MQDLTERKSAESRLIAAYEESEKLKMDFLADKSHEIRAHMHGMCAACTLLLDTPLFARQRDRYRQHDRRVRAGLATGYRQPTQSHQGPWELYRVRQVAARPYHEHGQGSRAASRSPRVRMSVLTKQLT